MVAFGTRMQRRPKEARWQFARITGQGLAAIAVLVGLLWACLAAERFTIANARAETRRTLRDLRHMRPVTLGAGHPPHALDSARPTRLRL